MGKNLTAMKPELKIDYATHKAAKYACENWHYSGCIPSSKKVCFSVYEENQYIGCIIFSYGASPNLYKLFTDKQNKCCELTRIALKKHNNPVSRILSVTLKKFKKDFPGIEVIISFADIDQNHIGVIYQATNWIYTGITSEGSINNFLVKGKKIHRKTIGDWFNSRGLSLTIENIRKYKDKNAEPIITKGKHKYVYPLTKEMKEFCLKLSKPYPKKCVEGVESDTSGVHLEEGGAVPTSTLMESI